MVGESFIKQQKHMAALEERETRLTTEVVELLKQNGKLLEAQKENKVKVDTLKKELG